MKFLWLKIKRVFIKPKLLYVSWDHRPAIVLSDVSQAYAIIEPNGGWVEVNALDVYHTGTIIHNFEQLKYIFSRYGDFEMPVELISD